MAQAGESGGGKEGHGSVGLERVSPLFQGDRGRSVPGHRCFAPSLRLLSFLALVISGPSLPAHFKSCLGFPLLEAKTCFSVCSVPLSVLRTYEELVDAYC